MLYKKSKPKPWRKSTPMANIRNSMMCTHTWHYTEKGPWKITEGEADCAEWCSYQTYWLTISRVCRFTVSGVLLGCFPIIKWLVTFLTLLICHLPVSLAGPNIITDHREVVEEINILWLGKPIHFIWKWQALFLLQGQDEYCGLKWAPLLSIPQSHPSKQGLELAWQRTGSCFFAWYSIFLSEKNRNTFHK